MIDIKDIAVAIIIGIVFGFGITFGCCQIFQMAPMRKEAVDRGFATWTITDTSTGQTEFRWNKGDIFHKNNQPLPTK